jgi:hypothetical protein
VAELGPIRDTVSSRSSSPCSTSINTQARSGLRAGRHHDQRVPREAAPEHRIRAAREIDHEPPVVVDGHARTALTELGEVPRERVGDPFEARFNDALRVPDAFMPVRPARNVNFYASNPSSTAMSANEYCS